MAPTVFSGSKSAKYSGVKQQQTRSMRRMSGASPCQQSTENNQGMMCRRRGPEPEQRERGNKEANMLSVCVYQVNGRARGGRTLDAGSAGLDNAAAKYCSPGPICEDLRCARFILIEQLLHESRIEVRPDLHDFIVFKSTDPTIPVFEWSAIQCSGESFQFNNCGVIGSNDVRDPEANTIFKDLVESVESTLNKNIPIMVVPGKWVSPHDRPINIWNDMLEKFFGVTPFQTCEE